MTARAPTGRFAPSTTGLAHPGTLVSALLAWLDVRALAGRALLRLENLDVTRCQPGWAAAMIDDLAWLGLDWDGVIDQSTRRADHEAALDALAAAGRLYPCACSRKDREGGRLIKLSDHRVREVEERPKDLRLAALRRTD